VAYVYHIKPKDINEVLKDEKLFFAMQEELHQFKRNQVSDRVPRTTTQ